MTILFILLCILAAYVIGVWMLSKVVDFLETDEGRLVGIMIFTIFGGIVLLFLNYAMYWNLFINTHESWFSTQLNQLATLIILVLDVVGVWCIRDLWKDR